MKTAVLITVVLVLAGFETKSDKVDSGVYSFSKINREKTVSGEQRRFMNGETKHMQNFEILATTLNPGKALKGNLVKNDEEQIVVIKDGQLKVVLNNETKELGAGSVVLVMPGDEFQMANTAGNKVTFYTIQYKSKKPMDTEQGKLAGGSAFIDWNDIKFTPHDKGGIRRYFDRKSAMSDRIEMHVTTLNPQIKSHEPHTHIPSEIVIMMDGKTEMEIGGKHYQGRAGDIYFLGSEIPHAIRNTGDKQCMYMAFQWE